MLPHLRPLPAQPIKIKPFWALGILAALIAVLLFANYSSLKGLQQAAVQRTQSEVKQWALETEYYFNERYNDIRDLADNSLVTAFFKNRSLGMSMHYGLRASLNNVTRTFNHYKKTIQLDNRSVYTRLYLVDTEGNILTSGSQYSAFAIQPVPEKHELQPGQVAVQSHSSGDISFTSPVYVHDTLQGYVVGWISYDALYQYLLGKRSELFFVVNNNRIVFQSQNTLQISPQALSQWRDHNSPLELKQQLFTESVLPQKGSGTNYFLFYADLANYPIRLYLAAAATTITNQDTYNFFIFGLIMLSAIVFLLVTVILQTNTRNLLLYTSLEAAVDRERIVNEQKQKLLESKEAAEAANKAKSTFLSNMSHELRTPLNAILGYCQIFTQDSSLTPKQQNGIRTMRQSGEHLLLLINDILDLSKIEAGKMELVATEFRPSEFLAGIADIIRIRAAEKGLHFHYKVEKTLPAGIAADALRLRQVLLNLLTNAVKFTRNGFCSLHVQAVSDTEQSCRLSFFIKDSGPGIASEMQKKVFEPFQQTGDRLKYAEGSGLGLAIARKLIRLMGGEIELLSPSTEQPKHGEGSGCCFFFTITVPVVAGLTDPIQKTAPMISGYQALDGTKKTILIVDDNDSNRNVLQDILEPLGFLTCEAVDGSTVEATCAQCQPDAILMDLRMPVVDGFTAIDQLKSVPELAHIPVIAITASMTTGDELRQRCRDHGFDGYISKPFSIDKLLHILARQLGLTLHRRKKAVTQAGEGDNMELPPPQYLETLVLLTRAGDIDGVLEKIEQLAKMESGRYNVLAQKIQSLADNLQLMAIEQLIASCTEE